MLQKITRMFRPQPPSLDRHFLAYHYISGVGIEIGALHSPLPVDKKKAVVKYVDRMKEDELRIQYPELNNLELVSVDYVANGEMLESIKDNTQDFVIANHFIEHCQDTILTIRNMLRVTKPGGIIFFAVPDKRFTFDKEREVTSVEHILRDFEHGPQHSRERHFEEWVNALNKGSDETFQKKEKKKLMEMDYSIHFHVWEKTDMDELLVFLMKTMKFNFEIELSLRKLRSNENIYILRKQGV